LSASCEAIGSDRRSIAEKSTSGIFNYPHTREHGRAERVRENQIE